MFQSFKSHGLGALVLGDLGSNKWDYVAVWTYGLLLTVPSIREK
jgi:hypothetical protein